MALTALYVAAAVALLLIGGGIFYACYQLALTVKSLRQILLPQVELTLTEVQRSLGHIDTLTQGVDTTVSEANQLVSSANQAVKSVGDGVGGMRRKLGISAQVAGAGLKTAWQVFRHPTKSASELAARRAAREHLASEAAAEGPEPALHVELEPLSPEAKARAASVAQS